MIGLDATILNVAAPDVRAGLVLGTAAALITPQTMALIVHLFPAGRRSRARLEWRSPGDVNLVSPTVRAPGLAGHALARSAVA